MPLSCSSHLTPYSSLTVIWVIVQYGNGAIKLFRQQHAGQPVGERKRGKRPRQVRGLFHAFGQAVSAAYDEGNVAPGIPPAGDTAGEFQGVKQPAALVQRDLVAAGRDGREYAL